MNIRKNLSDTAAGLMMQRVRGIKIVRALSDIIDNLIADAFDSVIGASLANMGSKIAVVATGGYGRQEMTAYSDVDIMLLAEKRDEFSAKTAELFLYHLWDMGMNISHSFRTLEECLEDAMEDITIRTSLLESRFIAGKRCLFEKYKSDIYQKIVFRKKSLFIKEIMQDVDKRHKKSGDSAYLLEPDIKEGKGGLRDMQTLRWLAKASLRIAEMLELKRIMSKEEYAQLIKAYDFLLKLRVCLHSISRRRNDILSFEFHKPAAEMMNIKTAKRHHAAEILMRLYYKKAAFIFNALDKVMDLSHGFYIQTQLDFSIKKLSSNFLLSKNEIIVRDRELLKNVDNILEAFYIYSKTGKKFSYQLKTDLLNRAIYISRRRNTTKSAAAFFLKILKGMRVYDTLRQMHDMVVIDRFLPEFGSLRHLVIYELYHKYTVDEHTLISIKNLENLKNTKDEKSQFLKKILLELKQEVLFFAILLHDIGKGVKSSSIRRHEEKGYRAIKSILERFDLPVSDRQRIEFLVKNHIILSKLALTRDSDATETVITLCEIAESEENLNYLLLMTYADMTAVNPRFWTEWKACLFYDLIKKAQQHMQGILEKRFEVSDPIINKFLEDMPHRYLISNAFDEILTDFSMSQQLKDKKVLISINPRGGGTAELVILTNDMPGLFLRIVRVLSMQGLNIIRARLYCSKSGFVVDKILLSNWCDICWEGLEDELKEKLQASIFGDSLRLKDQEHLLNISHNTKFLKGIVDLKRFEHFVEIDNETSTEYSILEIMSPDWLGLLYAISSRLYLNNIDIISAIINTEDGFAQDIFYTQCDGAKLNNETVVKVLDSIYKVVFKALDSG